MSDTNNQRRIDARKLAAAVDCDHRTALKFLRRERVLPALDRMLEREAKRLRIARDDPDGASEG